MSTIGRVVRETASLREHVTTSLRDAILSGYFEPGQKLVERELCSSLQISRTLLREALPQLQAEGLITSVAHKGPSVASVDADEVKEIYQIRRVLETLAARQFAKNATDSQIRLLREQLEELKRLEAKHNLRDLLIAKAGFYGVLFEGCGNQIIGQVLTQLNNRMVLCKRLSLSVEGRLTETIEEIENLVTAIESRDVERAGELSEFHVSKAEQTVLQSLAGGGEPSAK
jgi:DNA-binding GntR family transcriptional regulator